MIRNFNTQHLMARFRADAVNYSIYFEGFGYLDFCFIITLIVYKLYMIDAFCYCEILIYY